MKNTTIYLGLKGTYKL